MTNEFSYENFTVGELLSLVYRRYRQNYRKLYLINIACFRTIHNLIESDFIHNVISNIEMYADGLITASEMRTICNETSSFLRRQEELHSSNRNFKYGLNIRISKQQLKILSALYSVCTIGYCTLSSITSLLSSYFLGPSLITEETVRTIINNATYDGFISPQYNPQWFTWNDNTPIKIAKHIYDNKSFERMDILSDALEEAGCDNKDILDYCRKDTIRFRGDWLLDLIMGLA